MGAKDTHLQDDAVNLGADRLMGEFRGGVSAVVVSYNTRVLTLGCVDAICADSSVGSVCVVDNGSTDGSQEALIRRSCQQHETPDGPSLMVECLTENRGFGGANNIGAGCTKGEFILLVNSDAFILNDAIKTMREYLLAHPKVGVVGPRLLNTDGSFQESRFPFPSPARAWFENLGFGRLKKMLPLRPSFYSGRVDWLSGACVMIRRSVWDAVRGFDEEFFLYSEETDLQLRIQRKGWAIHWVPEALVTHVGGGSGGVQKEAVREFFFQGVDRYFLKHHGKLGAVSLRGATMVGGTLRWLEASALAQPERKKEAGWIVKRQATRPFPKCKGVEVGNPL